MTENKLVSAVEDINNNTLINELIEDASGKLINSMSDEQKEDLCRNINDAFICLGNAICAFGRAAAVAMQSVSTLSENILEILSEDIKIKSYPNKKIVHLALYSKKARVRNKNRNRILKDLGMR